MGNIISRFRRDRPVILSGNLFAYKVQTFIGEGKFGRVAHCTTLGTKENVAVKIFKKNPNKLQIAVRELQMMKKINNLDPDKYNLVRHIEFFSHENFVCLVFEKLDKNLNDFIKQNGKLNVKEIRPIAQQMLVALDALKHIDVIHTDIKPDNVMLVDHRRQPFKIKLIDFGVAVLASQNNQGKIMQPLIYRSPEVMLGLPVTAAIDMWSLGCLLAYLYTGKHLYEGAACEYDVMRLIVHLQGQPSNRLLSAGNKAQNFFKYTKGKWNLKTPKEKYSETTHDVLKGVHIQSLNDLTMCHPKPKSEKESNDMQAFLSLITWMLHPDFDRRPQHSFIEEKHLTELPKNDTVAKLGEPTSISHPNEEVPGATARTATSALIVNIVPADDPGEGPSSLARHQFY